MKTRLLLLLGASLIAFLAAEIVLRMAKVTHPNFYRHDTVLGASLRPGAEGWWLREGEAYVRINSRGLRDREHTLAKPEGAFRIAILGDSYAEALQLPMKDAFWAVMERELRSCGALAGREPEAINFGVSGYGTAQQLLSLRHRGWQYDPDAVVLAVTTGNDIRNNLRELEGDPHRPYFVYRDDELILDNSFRDWTPPPSPLKREPLVTIYDHSRLLQLLKAAVDRIRFPAPEAAEKGGGEIGLDDNVYREPEDPLWQEAWRVTGGILGLAGREAAAKGVDLLVVTLTNGAQVHPDPAFRRARAAQIGVPDLSYPDRRIGAVCEEQGIPFLALGEALRAGAEEEGVYLHGFGDSPGGGHWNANGHRLGGELIARRLCTMLEEKGRP